MSYLVFDPVDGDHQDCNTLKEAQKEAKEMIQLILDHCDGWPEEMESTGVRIYKLIEQSEICDVQKKEDYSEEEWADKTHDPDHSYICSYKMQKVTE